MRFLLGLVASGVLTLGAVTTVAAQSLANPPGSVRGLFGGGDPPSPTRTTQQVSTWLDLSGGYDDNLDLSGVGGVDGAAATALGGFRFWRGRQTRSFEATTRVFRNSQRGGSVTSSGGEVTVNGNFEVRRRFGLRASLRGANDSAVLFGALRQVASAAPPVDAEILIPDVSPQQGAVTDRWYSLEATADAFRQWTARQRTSTRYAQVRRRPTDTTRGSVSADQRVASLRHDWMFSGNTGLVSTYRFERVDQALPIALESAPTQTQALEAGVLWQRRFTPIRAASASIQVGATQVLASDGNNIAGTTQPTGAMTATYTLTNRWAISANATRGVTVLQGASQAAFTNDLASLTLSGIVARRLTLALTGSIAQGRSVQPGSGTFDAVGGTAAVRYTFRYAGLFVGYTQYEHQLRGPAAGQGLIAPRFDQKSLRAGVTLWLPLFGAF